MPSYEAISTNKKIQSEIHHNLIARNIKSYEVRIDYHALTAAYNKAK